MTETHAQRARLGKLIGLLGSSSEGERANALAAVDKALRDAALSWGWLATLVSRGELPSIDTDRVYKRLVIDRVRRGLDAAWCMDGADAKFIRQVLSDCEGGAAVSAGELLRAIAIADKAQRRAGR